MRLASLERLAEGMRQAPHDHRASLQVFPDISVDSLARELQVVERGRENAKLDLPAPASASFDDVEYAVIERLFSDRKAAHHTLVDELQTYAQRLAALDFHGRFTVIQHAAPAAVSEFRAEAHQGRDQLHQLRRALLENETERNDFRAQCRLRRAPRLSGSVATFFKVTLLAFLFVSETYVNAVFLAKGQVLGFIGGVAEALVFAILNILISFGIGLIGLRQLNYPRFFRKLLGLLSLAAWLAFAVLLNLALAHYRELSGALYEDAGARVIARVWESPAGLNDIKSWLFFAIGMVWSVIALIDGIFFTDPFPGYASLERRVRDAHASYIARKEDLIGQLRDIRDEAAKKMEDAQSDLAKRRREHSAILENRGRMLGLFEQYQDQLERAGNALLAKYRAANRQERKTAAPSRFDEHWRMERVPPESQLPEALLQDSLDEDIRKARDLLGQEILAIYEAFEQAVESYHQIDRLFPEDSHGAQAA